MIELDISDIELKLKKEQGKTYVFDNFRKKWVVLTPEEHVRQYVLLYLTKKLNYPASRIAVEKQVLVNGLSKRFDAVVFDIDHKPWMIIECKAPDVPITESTLNQLLQYHNKLQCSYWLITNGHQSFCADACNGEAVTWLKELPFSN